MCGLTRNGSGHPCVYSSQRQRGGIGWSIRVGTRTTEISVRQIEQLFGFVERYPAGLEPWFEALEPRFQIIDACLQYFLAAIEIDEGFWAQGREGEDKSQATRGCGFSLPANGAKESKGQFGRVVDIEWLL